MKEFEIIDFEIEQAFRTAIWAKQFEIIKGLFNEMENPTAEELIEELKKNEMKENLVEYAYLCNECCTILECPCFIRGKCPECGSKSKAILYLKVRRENEKNNSKTPHNLRK